MGLAHEAQLGPMTWFTSFDWFRHVVRLTRQSHLMDFPLRLIVSDESPDADYESSKDRVERRTSI